MNDDLIGRALIEINVRKTSPDPVVIIPDRKSFVAILVL